MRFHLTSALLFVAIFSTLLIVLYQALTSNQEQTRPSKKSENVIFLESRVNKLQDDLAANHETVLEIKNILQQMADSDISKNLLESPKLPLNKFHRENVVPVYPLFNATTSVILKDDCIFSESPSASVDIQMNDVLDHLPFDNPDGGVWKQGWPIEVDPSQWSSTNKLKVYVVPHSHNDPGWIKTFEKYFSDQTEHILDNVVKKLPEDPRRRFIYAEISFFSMWWDKQPEAIRTKVKKLVSSGQFELVNGGLVMPDEASTHYFSVLDQLLTGHEWLQENLGIKPSNNWAIDPFGLSPSMAYLWKMSGMENMLIQRAHYSVKKHLAREKSLEFRWKQHWDSGDTSEILCHMMPFYSYDIPHTCGPDPKVCCQFDFNRLPGSGIVCPWHVPPQAINDRNIKSRAEMLLDQYRKKSQLFRTNVVLVPLGDDFRYDRPAEWDKQFINYQKLFDHMNEREDLHVEAQFGTLSDYFGALRKEASSQNGGSENSFFPSLSGDFFSYSDRDDHYWTGYFTTRPFYKHMDRVLHHYIRSAEILFSLMLDTEGHSGIEQNPLINSLREKLDAAHFNLGLFQHHDGITGTSKSHVLIDYANKLITSIKNSQQVISHAAHSLLRKSPSNLPNLESDYFSMDEEFTDHKSLPKRNALKLNEGISKTFYVFNSEAQKRQQLFSVLTDHPYVEVMDRSGEVILCQVDPVFSHNGLVEDSLYQVFFIVSLDPLSLSAYSIKGLTVDTLNNRLTTYGKVTVVNSNSVPLQDIFSPTVKETESPISMKCGQMSAEFNENGFMKSFTTLSQKVETNLEFVVYQTRASGAYLFMPNGEAQPIATINLPKIMVEGPLKASLTVYSSVVKHQIVLKNSPGLDGIAPTINNIVDITARLDIELAMRFSTSIKNGPLFYTDLNGFQMMKRTRYAKLPLQANYYPMSSQAYIEDSTERLSILSASPLGAASLKEGQIEIMLDRQLTRDDNRGLGQGIRDNVVTHQKFHIMYEKKLVSKEYTTHHESPLPLPSMAAHGLTTLLLHPLNALHPAKQDVTYAKYWSVGGDLPCDVSLVALRHLDTKRRNSPSIALTLHRLGFSCSFVSYGNICVTTHGKVRLTDVFPASFADEVTQMTLTHLYEGVSITKSYPLSLQPMQIQSYRLSLSSSSQ